MNNPKLRFKSFAYLESKLGLTRADLELLVQRKDSLYKSKVLEEKKADGRIKERTIQVPRGKLAEAQARIKIRLLDSSGLLLKEMLPENMMGGVKKRSIADNAALHTNKEVVVTMDIADCFPSVTTRMIEAVWIKKFRFGKAAARLLAELVTLDGCLPQGTRTSPGLCNLALSPMFTQISKVAKKHNLTSSIWVDDIVLSGSRKNTLGIIGSVNGIMRGHGFKPSARKLKISAQGFQQMVNGVPVNDIVGVDRRRYEKVRKQIVDATDEDLADDSWIRSVSGKVNAMRHKTKKLKSLLDARKQAR